jgi:hypothetical protein
VPDYLKDNAFVALVNTLAFPEAPFIKTKEEGAHKTPQTPSSFDIIYAPSKIIITCA